MDQLTQNSQYKKWENFKITIIGVGGAGNNAVNMMIDENLPNINYIAANTDSQALEHSKCENKLTLGKSNNGFGAGSNPELGLELAKESIEDIKEKLSGSKIVIVTAGFGGGTGTGAAPLIAQIAKEQGALVLGIVSTPFTYEGKARNKIATNGIENLKQNTDAYLVLSNQKISELNPSVPSADLYRLANVSLKNIVVAINDILNKVGFINIDFADFKNALTNSGKSIINVTQGSGESKVSKALNKLFEPNYYDYPLFAPSRLLINLQYDQNTTSAQIQEAIMGVYKKLNIDEANESEAIKIGQEIINTPHNAGFFKITVIGSGEDEQVDKNIYVQEEKVEVIEQINELEDIKQDTIILEDVQSIIEQEIKLQTQDTEILKVEEDAADASKENPSIELLNYFNIPNENEVDDSKTKVWFN
ncbi:cell division protein FtsZ [Mycoplasma sp. 1199]|uniref:cell division protein FtsZ n=1 Tax=Mycoplasma sp. 1199 TaxID=3108526 RepID=UPI002B1D66C9|nr:cell division protein FtsZ [Mycoplasma sp. 1199]MEA4206194.1 cell division protein FtsZ [Mycoplasma sp. 1199]